MAIFLQSQAVNEIAQHAQAAREAQRRDDFPTAVREYEALVRLLPQSAEMQSNLGMALYFNHELTRAVTVLQKAASLNAKLVAPHLFSGLAWYRQSEPDKAVPELEKAVELSPSDVIAHTWLGYAYVAQSRYQLALQEFKTASELDPGNIDVWYALGKTHLEAGRDATVQLIAVAPDGGRIWQLSGEQLFLKGERKGALEDFKQAFVRRPDVAELPVLITELGGVPPSAPQSALAVNAEEDTFYLQAHKEERESQTAFQHVVEIAPDSYRAHQIVADAFAAGEKWEEAIEEYQAVLKQKPDLPGIHEAIGTAKLRRSKLEEALSEFEAELQLQPRSAGLHTNVAQVMVLMARDDEARKHLETALGLDRPPAEIYLLLGKVELNRKDYRSAVKTLTHYLSLKKDDSTAYYLLSRAYLRMGDREAADRALDLFKRTSIDLKTQKRAQKELGVLADQKVLSEEVVDVGIQQPN